MNNFRTVLGDLSLLHWLLVTILPAIITFILGRNLGFWRKQQTVFFNNLQRPIAIISNKGELVRNEIMSIQTSGIFNLKNEDIFLTCNQFTGKKDYGLIIFIYNKDNIEGYKDIVVMAKAKHLPILVYANHQEIDRDLLPEIKSYPNMHLSQYSMNFISAIFTTLATFNHGSK